ncbi:MAG: YigZ family protein [[Eubacterium] siraeum]
MSYKTIRNRMKRLLPRKSEFIGYISPAGTEEEAIGFINEIRAMHRKATHNCYAYILRNNNTGRHSDDRRTGRYCGYAHL